MCICGVDVVQTGMYRLWVWFEKVCACGRERFVHGVGVVLRRSWHISKFLFSH